jgi:mono/diheme cytochrome c family protein
VRLAPLIAGGLAIAAAGMTVAAFTAGDGEPPRAAAPSPTATPSPAAPAAAPRNGQTVWAEQGCGSCHTLAAAGATGTLGPDLASSLKGEPVASIREAIVAPAATAAAGYPVGMMPEDYASRMPPGDLELLVRFLRDSTR